MLKKILIGLAALVAVIAIVVMLQPDTYHVERSIRINAPAEAVWRQVSDFNRWKEWNPWEKSEPDQQTTISGTPGSVGHASRWKGEQTGEGTMTIRTVDEPNRVDIALDFKAPMEASADTTIAIEPRKEAVEVTWSIDGSNDFMGKMFGLLMDMEGMIGTAYEQGLADLKVIAEQDAAQGTDAPRTN